MSFVKSGITMLIHNKDDIEFVTEFPCLLGHPVVSCPWMYLLLTPQLHFESEMELYGPLNMMYCAWTTYSLSVLQCVHA